MQLSILGENGKKKKVVLLYEKWGKKGWSSVSKVSSGQVRALGFMQERIQGEPQ